MDLIIMHFGVFGVGFMLGVIITKIAANNNASNQNPRSEEIKENK